jgi:hypothetical protein
MRASLAVPFILLLLGACTDSPATSRGGRCLYAVEMEYGQNMKWGSCTSPPANTIRRLSEPGS